MNPLCQHFDEHVVPGAGARFAGEDVREWIGPIVYMFILKGKPLYVGMSRTGIARAFQASHKQAARTRAQCDEMLAWPCRSAEAARKLEALLIGTLRPCINNRQRDALASLILGVKPKRVSELRGPTSDKGYYVNSL